MTDQPDPPASTASALAKPTKAELRAMPVHAPLIVRLIATWFGAGRSPIGPGTMGTLGAIPLAYVLSLGPRWVFFLGLIVVTGVGTWAAEQFVRATGIDDDQRIVVDEVAGYLLTLVAVPHTWVHLVLAFVLFRIFDIWKPQPVRWVDANISGGIGVMADDLAAGIYAAICMEGLELLHVPIKILGWFTHA